MSREGDSYSGTETITSDQPIGILMYSVYILCFLHILQCLYDSIICRFSMFLNYLFHYLAFYFYFKLDKAVKNTSDEFVSDTLQATSQDLVEVQEGMKKLVLGSKTCGE